MERAAILIALSLFTSFTFCACGSFRTDGNGSDAMTEFDNECQSTDAQNHRYNCGDGFCWCCRTHGGIYMDADCSGHYGSLNYVPRLPEDTTFLNFSYNGLNVIPDFFFLNVTNLVILDLSGNNVSVISPRVFSNLNNLNQVLLNYNFYVNYSTLLPVFTITKLTKFSLRHGSLKAIPRGFFHNLTMPHLTTLLLNDNRIGNLYMGEFTSLRRLTSLSIANNKVSEVHEANLPALMMLDLQTNGIFNFLQTCRKSSNRSRFPNLIKLILRENLISNFPKRICLPKLQKLELSSNLFQYIWPDMFRHFPNLVNLSMESMVNNIMQIREFAFRSKTLQNVSLMYNNIEFGEKIVDDRSFIGCPSIVSLQLSHNYFNHMSDIKFRTLFGNLTRLENLYLGNSRIGKISRSAFKYFASVKRLHLYQNVLTDLPDGAFDTMTSLEELLLNDNSIAVIRESTFSPEARARLRQLDISGNPLQCSCPLVWFQKWFASSPELFASTKGVYTCDNPQGVPLASFYLSDQACLLTSDAYVMVTATAAMLIVTLTLVVILFRYRWHFRLLMYEAFRAGSERRQQRFVSRGFRYDIFLSYANEDVTWVSHYLVPWLQEGLGLRLCLHQRDFIPGRHIIDNIASSVETSKKMVMVFSEHFARSQWCQFELALCLHHAMDHDDALLIVCLDNISSRDLTAAMLAVLKTTTFIQWDDDSDAQSSFWGRLRVALREITLNENI